MASRHPGNARYISDDEKVSFDAVGRRLDSVGNVARPPRPSKWNTLGPFHTLEWVNPQTAYAIAPRDLDPDLKWWKPPRYQDKQGGIQNMKVWPGSL